MRFAELTCSHLSTSDEASSVDLPATVSGINALPKRKCRKNIVTERGLAPRSMVDIKATAAEKRAQKDEATQAKEAIARDKERRRSEAIRILAELDAEREAEESAERESFERTAHATDREEKEDGAGHDGDNKDDEGEAEEMVVDVDDALKVSAFSHGFYVDHS